MLTLHLLASTLSLPRAYSAVTPGLLCLYSPFTLHLLFVLSPITRAYPPFTRLYSLPTLCLPCVHPGLLCLYHPFTLRLLFVFSPLTRAYPPFTLVSTLALLPHYSMLTLHLPLDYFSLVLPIFFKYA